MSIGSRYIHEGYVVINLKQADTFFAMCSKSKSGTYGYVFEHRLVMAKHLGRCLEPWELVHHRNGERADKLISSPRVEDDVSVFSLPPVGSSKVANIYLDPAADELVVKI